MKAKLLVLTVASAFVLSAPAVAQPAAPVCKGTIETIRVSTLKPGATVDAFNKAVAKHIAWYRAHGFKDNSQIVATVLTRDGVSKTQVATIHMNPPGVAPAQQDAGWREFVAAYRAVSDIASEVTICVPKG
jgi:hypothetical protein